MSSSILGQGTCLGSGPGHPWSGGSLTWNIVPCIQRLGITTKGFFSHIDFSPYLKSNTYLMQTLAHSVRGVMDEMRQIPTDYRNPVEEKR